MLLHGNNLRTSLKSRALLGLVLNPRLVGTRRVHMGFENELVEDSEPEREQLRQIRRRGRSSGKSREVIEGQRLHPSQQSPSNVFVDACTNQTASRRRPIDNACQSEVATTPLSADIIEIETSHNYSPPPLESPPNAILGGIDIPPDETHVALPAKSNSWALLRDFAYQSPPKRRRLAVNGEIPLQNHSTSLSGSSSTHSPIDTVASKPKGKKAASNTPSGGHFDIPESEFAKVLACVSCGVRWTSRKTAAQKLLHMKTCAKKQGLTQETIQRLVHREIDNQVSEASNGGSSKPRAENASTTAPRTYIEEIIHDTTSAARKDRSRSSLPTVKNIFDAQGEIKHRAKSILGGQSSTSTIPTTQAFGSSKLAVLLQSDDEPPPITQPFQRSSLAELIQQPESSLSRISNSLATKRSLFYEEGVDEDTVDTNDDMSPSAADGTVKFSNSFTHPSVPTPMPYTYRVNALAISTDPQPAASSSSFHTNAPNSNLRSNVNTHIDSHIKVVHSEHPPAPDYQSQLFRCPPLQPSSSLVKDHTSKKEDRNHKARATTTKRPRKKKPEDEEQDDQNLDFSQLHQVMEEHILKDDKLYLMILRYEPISFDIFMDIASQYGMPSRGLKLKVREYLDAKAICFYDPTSNKRR